MTRLRVPVPWAATASSGDQAPCLGNLHLNLFPISTMLQLQQWPLPGCTQLQASSHIWCWA